VIIFHLWFSFMELSYSWRRRKWLNGILLGAFSNIRRCFQHYPRCFRHYTQWFEQAVLSEFRYYTQWLEHYTWKAATVDGVSVDNLKFYYYFYYYYASTRCFRHLYDAVVRALYAVLSPLYGLLIPLYALLSPYPVLSQLYAVVRALYAVLYNWRVYNIGI
jgi:hypothetical protein